MSADSDLPASPEPSNAPAPGEVPLTPPTHKRRYRKPDALTTGLGDDPDSEIIILSSLLQNLLERKQSGEAVQTEGEVRSKINRFVARGTSAPGNQASVPSAQAPSAPVEADPLTATPEPAAATPPPARPAAGSPEAMAAIAFPKFEPRPYPIDPEAGNLLRTGSTWGRGILPFAFAAVVGLVAFLAGRYDSSRNQPTAPPPAPEVTLASWTPTFTAGLDEALAADHAGDLNTANRIATDLQKNMGSNPVLDAYQSTVETRLGRTNDVEAHLSRQIGPNAPAVVSALLNDAQGFNYSRRREFDHAIDCFAAVAALQPFNTANLLHLAEAQRRGGKLSDAVGTLQLARKRLPVGAPETEDQREYLAFKQRLSQIEIGQENDFKSELDQRASSTPPAPYWLLTSAALALQKNDLPAAVTALQKAQGLLPPARFAALLDDYFFRSFIHHPELDPFFPPATPERQKSRAASMEYFLDP